MRSLQWRARSSPHLQQIGGAQYGESATKFLRTQIGKFGTFADRVFLLFRCCLYAYVSANNTKHRCGNCETRYEIKLLIGDGFCVFELLVKKQSTGFV